MFSPFHMIQISVFLLISCDLTTCTRDIGYWMHGSMDKYFDKWMHGRPEIDTVWLVDE
jgi:hypothetical protein